MEDFSKNGLIGSAIVFDPADFVVKPDKKAALAGITLDQLPDAGAGVLNIGGQPLEPGACIDATALSGLRFQCAKNPTVTTATLLFTPAFSDCQGERQTTVTLYLLTQENNPPVARNMELTTYKNVAITGYFDAVDGEGDSLTFQLTSTPARGAVTLAEDGQFVYTPYENKTGRDSFTYVAIDPAGNTSPEAKEKVLELARLLTAYCGRLRVHIVPFTEIQEEIRRKCPEEYFTLIMRRWPRCPCASTSRIPR